MKKMYNSPITESLEIQTLGVIMSGSGETEGPNNSPTLNPVADNPGYYGAPRRVF